MVLGDYLNIKAGLQNFFVPYGSTILPTNTSIQKKSMGKFGGGLWIVYADYEIIVSAKRLERDNIDLELGNVEREIQRIICQYKPGDIAGIDEMIYGGQERIYGINDNWAKANWATRIFLTIRLQQINDDPFT